MFDFAVIVQSTLRPSLLRACRSVIDQAVEGSINLMIGVDEALGERAILDELIRLARPPKRRVTVIDVGYSTTALRGGFFPCRGGGLRSALSFLGNARYLAFLDDDNWLAPNHLDSLARAIEGKEWAHSLRVFVDSRSGAPLGIDQWESVGPGQGIHQKRFGGFCDTSTYLLDALATESVLPHWSYGISPDGSGVDRRIFQELRRKPHGASGLATVYYTLRHTDLNHGARLRLLESTGARPSRPTPFTEAAARLGGAGRRRPATPIDQPPAAADALRTALIEAKAANVVVIGGSEPGFETLIAELAATSGRAPDIIDLDAEGADPIVTARRLRAEEVLADVAYLGRCAAERVESSLSALWSITRRTGLILGPAATGAEAKAQRDALERFARRHATRLAWLGPAGTQYFLLPRY